MKRSGKRRARRRLDDWLVLVNEFENEYDVDERKTLTFDEFVEVVRKAIEGES